MSIINKQSVTVDNDTYDLLGIDDKSQKSMLQIESDALTSSSSWKTIIL